MGRFLARRLAWAGVVTWLAASATLLLGHVGGSDFVVQRFGIGARAQLVAAERHRRGLDRPILVQYGAWLAGVARLDLGRSARDDQPVAAIVAAAGFNTALIAVPAFALALALGIPLGVLTGSRREGVLPATIRAASLLLISVPPILTSLALVWLAAVTGLVPVGGMHSGSAPATTLASVTDLLLHLPLPIVALALPLAATLERVQADALARAIAEPAVAAARARGISTRRLLWRHAWRLGAGPVISVCGVMAGSLLSGAFAVELVTNWPGLARQAVEAVQSRDIYLSAGCALAAAVLLSIGVLAADVALALVDPRVIDADGRGELA